jgi:hypothetical protein
MKTIAAPALQQRLAGTGEIALLDVREQGVHCKRTRRHSSGSRPSMPASPEVTMQ